MRYYFCIIRKESKQLSCGLRTILQKNKTEWRERKSSLTDRMIAWKDGKMQNKIKMRMDEEGK